MSTTSLRAALPVSLLAAFVAATPALADSTAFVQTPSGASLVATMTVTVGTSLGTSTDSDTKTVAVVGSSDLVLAPTNPTWTGVTLDTFHLDPADVSFHFDLFCFPFLGCQSLDVSVTGLVLDTTAPVSSPLSGTGAASFANAPFFLQGAYTTTGIATASGTLANATTSNFGCRVTPQANQTVRIDQASIAPITTVVDPASLPAGVNSLTITFATNLANTTFVGAWTPFNPYDLNGDGLVNGADLAVLLTNWGGGKQGDLNGDGLIDAADLSILLSNWS
jgi:hypothetical protein